MRMILRGLAVLTALSCAPALAQPRSSAWAAIGMAAQAAALSEFCVNWAVDPVAVRSYLHSRNLRIAGDNRAVFGAAYARAHEEAWRGGDFPVACDKALDLYGPRGRVAAGLVRPVWHGACGDCQVGDSAKAAANAADP